MRAVWRWPKSFAYRGSRSTRMIFVQLFVRVSRAGQYANDFSARILGRTGREARIGGHHRSSCGSPSSENSGFCTIPDPRAENAAFPGMKPRFCTIPRSAAAPFPGPQRLSPVPHISTSENLQVRDLPAFRRKDGGAGIYPVLRSIVVQSPGLAPETNEKTALAKPRTRSSRWPNARCAEGRVGRRRADETASRSPPLPAVGL